jgi:hypothetical protein
MSEEVEEEEAPTRNWFIDLTGIKLDSYDGQNYILLQCQEAVATQDLSKADMNAIYMLKELVKVKRNVDVLRLQRDVDAIKERMKEKKSMQQS